jgi:monoamine oxidase
MDSGSSVEIPVRLDAIIVGAGFAGLAAARRLVSAGLEVVVLEATDRVGGRALTDYRLAEGAPLELGAQMVHGRHASTHAWVGEAGLHVKPLRLHQRSRLIVDRRVGRFPWFAFPFHPVAGTRATLDGLRRIPRALEEYRGPDRTLRTFLDERSVTPPVRSLVDLFHAHSYSADPDSIGVVGAGGEERLASEPFGFRNFRVVEGYTALIDWIAKGLGNRVLTDRAVTDVRLEPEGVRVRASGSVGREDTEYLARCAIVTVPLGVLKSGAIHFEPALPEEKRAAIERVGFGNVFALQLRLRGGTMRRLLGDFGVLWGDTSTSFRRPHPPLPNHDDLLTAFTTGREARRRAGLTDEALVAATVEEWDSITPTGARLGSVVGWVVHRWPTDPWTRGGYSYFPPGSNLGDRKALAAPVGGRLFFAGEATDVDGGSATVPGALRTGERAADELIAALRGPAPPLDSRNVPAFASPRRP